MTPANQMPPSTVLSYQFVVNGCRCPGEIRKRSENVRWAFCKQLSNSAREIAGKQNQRKPVNNEGLSTLFDSRTFHSTGVEWWPYSAHVTRQWFDDGICLVRPLLPKYLRIATKGWLFTSHNRSITLYTYIILTRGRKGKSFVLGMYLKLTDV